MKAIDLIEKLMGCDPETEVEIVVELNDIGCRLPVLSVEAHKYYTRIYLKPLTFEVDDVNRTV